MSSPVDHFIPTSSPIISNTLVQQRIRLIGDRGKLSDQVLTNLIEIKKTLEKAAENVAKLVQEVDHETGRLIASIDKLKEASNIACESMILPNLK